MTVTASAETREGSITLTTSNANSETGLTGDFTAYRIIDFHYSGTAINYQINEYFEDFFDTKSCDDAKAAYDYIANTATNNTMDTLRQEIKTFVNGKDLSKSKVTGTITDKTKVEFTNVTNGYYVIIPSNNLYAINLLNVDGDVSAFVKIVSPTPDKTAQDADDAWKEAISASVGTTVPFEVKSVIPDITDETDNYYFIMKDTMSAGLTYVDGSLKVSVAGNDVTVTPIVSDDERTLTVSIPLIDTGSKVDYRGNIGQDIVITYSAKVGTDAVTVDPKNHVQLSYGNSPDFGGDGNTKPEQTDEVPVYNHDLTIENVDKSSPENHIGGGKFTVTGPDDTTVELVKTDDGSYRPFVTGVDSEENKVTEITLPDTGTVVIKGLDSGTYTVTQTTPPAGYGAPAQKEIPVTFQENDNGDGTAKFVNGAGTGLPETGGMGTVIFTVVGLALIAAVAGSFVISRRKKNS